jgi:flagellar hook-length control protein FliK
MLVSSLSLDSGTATDLPADPGGITPLSNGTAGDAFAAQLALAMGGTAPGTDADPATAGLQSLQLMQALEGAPIGGLQPDGTEPPTTGLGQDLAAAGLDLKTLALGPSLELVTASGPQPDAASLAAFATAQGLDPQVVAWLFTGPGREGDNPASDGQTTGTDLEPTVTTSAEGAGVPLTSGIPASMAPFQAPSGRPTSQAAGDSAADAGPAGPRTVSTASPGSGLPLPLALPLAISGMGGLAGWGSVQPGAPAAAAASTDAIEAATLAAGQILQPGARLALVQASATARQQALATRSELEEVPVEILSLDIEPDLLQSLLDERAASPARVDALGSPSAGGSASSAQAGADKTLASHTTSQLQQRAEGLQALAQRLGEAVGQRVLGQLARGQWAMKLMLKPATLGDVEVDLRMRAGELDAAFRVTNAAARDLLNEGLPRLREVLSSAGMDIAGLHVGLGSSQRHGGNPTPRQAMGDANLPGRDGDAIIQAAPTSIPLARRLVDGVNWDVLV